MEKGKKFNNQDLIISDQFYYRVASMNQVLELIEFGYVIPKSNWEIGENKSYQDKRPVISAPIDVIKNEQIDAIPITDLSAIWIYNHNDMVYENKLKEILNMYKAYQIDKSKIDTNEKRK